MNLSQIKEWVNVKQIRGNEVLALCPFHDDKNPSFWINTQKQIYHCFACGAKGKLNRERKTTFNAIENLLLETKQINGSSPTIFALPDSYVRLSSPNRLSKPYWEYLKKRGIMDKVIQRFKLGYCWEGDYGDRVIVPLEKGFVGRTILGETMNNLLYGRDEKYLYPLGLPKSELFFNFQTQNQLIIVEGVFDVLKLATFGVEATAIFGCQLSESQLKRILKNRHSEIVICLDGDESGINGTKKIYGQLVRYFKNISIIYLPVGIDPCDLDKEQWGFYFENRVPGKELKPKHNLNLERVLLEI